MHYVPNARRMARSAVAVPIHGPTAPLGLRLSLFKCRMYGSNPEMLSAALSAPDERPGDTDARPIAKSRVSVPPEVATRDGSWALGPSGTRACDQRAGVKPEYPAEVSSWLPISRMKL
jgi:hypothetical protein